MAPEENGRMCFWTVNEVSAMLRLGINATRRAIEAGDIRAVKIGGSYRVPQAEIDRLARGESA